MSGIKYELYTDVNNFENGVLSTKVIRAFLVQEISVEMIRIKYFLSKKKTFSSILDELKVTKLRYRSEWACLFFLIKSQLCLILFKYIFYIFKGLVRNETILVVGSQECKK